MARKEVKEEESSDEYTYVTTEGEEEPGAEEPPRAERDRGKSALPVRPAAAASTPSMPAPPTSPPPARSAATGCDREPSEESDRAPRARPPRSPFSPGRNDREETHGRRRRKHARRAQDPPEPSGTAAPGAEMQKGKGKRRRQKAPDARQCPICRATVGNHESSLSQHQYWNEDCNARRIWNEQYCTWTAARRQALQLKEEREDAYYNRDVPVTPAPSLAVRNKIEGREDTGKEEEEDKEPEDKEKKTKKKKDKRKKRRHHRRHSPSPDLSRDRRRSKRPPSDDEDEDLPKVKRGPGGSFILQFTPKVS